MEGGKWGLRARLLSVTITLALLVTVLFGVVAYRITVQAAMDRESAGLAEKAGLISAYVMQHIDTASTAHVDEEGLRKKLLPLLAGETLISISSPRLESRIELGPSLSATRIAQLTETTAAPGRSAGKLDLDGKRFLWVENSAYSPLRVLLIRQTDIVDEALSVVARRLLLTGIGAMWIALWGGLILTAAVAKRQESHNAVLAHRAGHDDLTGLPNRTRLHACLNHAAETGTSGALLMMDLDRFKEVNDTLGHHYGDELLIELGPRLDGSLREGDLLARLGGDEFAIWLPGADEEQGKNVAQRIIASLEQPLQVMGMPLEANVSVGIACFPLHAACMDG